MRLYDDVSGGMKKTGAAMVLQPDDDKSPVIGEHGHSVRCLVDSD